MVNETETPKVVDVGSGSGGEKVEALVNGKGSMDGGTRTPYSMFIHRMPTLQKIWKKLDHTHNIDSQGLEKYFVVRFLNFKLVDGKFMTEKVHEFKMLVHALGESGIILPEKFKVMSVIEKLPKSWNDNTKIDKNNAKKPKKNKPYGSFGQVGHWRKDCPVNKAKKAGMVAQANTVLGLGTTSGPMIDTGANVHIYADITLFEFYQHSHGKTVMMGNASAPQVLEVGNVDLKVPLKYMDKTPYALWKKRKTSLSYLRVWGFFAKVLVPEHKRKKLGLKIIDCIFLGYLKTTTTMRFLVLKSDMDGIVVNKIVEFRDTTFFEEVFPMKTGIPLGNSEDDPTCTLSYVPDHVEKIKNMGVDPGSISTPNQVQEPIRSKRAKIVKDLGSDFITYNVEDEPLTFCQAMDSSELRHWKGVMKSEIDSFISNGTWELVNLLPRFSTIGCKWIFKKKINPDGSIDKYKARLVAKGFRQNEGIDYFDDILLFGTNIEFNNETKSFLKRHFEIKDLSEASVILGIKLTQSTNGIILSHSHYKKKAILEKTVDEKTPDFQEKKKLMWKDKTPAPNRDTILVKKIYSGGS
ncbi:hypothetical protein AgCh_023776 [Apium graveolens]